MNDTERQLEALQAEVRRLSSAQRRARVWPLVVGALFVAGVVLAQPVVTTFNANQPALASEVNGNFAQLAAFSVPSGGIIFFDGATCPAGWTQVAQGRAIVGRPGGGSNGQTFGSALTNNVEPTHAHGTSVAGAHAHGGETGSYSNWVPGIVNWVVQVGFVNDFHHRHAISADGAHSHSVTNTGAGAVLPYMYYTACRKN